MATDPKNIEGKVVLLTGASKGIGRAIALSLASAGAKLALLSRNVEKLDSLAAELEGKAEVFTLPCDLTEIQGISVACKKVLERFSKVDVLINNAGIVHPNSRLDQVSTEDIERVITTNLTAPICFMKELIPSMLENKSGTIINVNSIAGKTAYPYWSVYVASKFGLRAVTDSVFEEYRKDGLRVIGIHPGAVNTPIWDSIDLGDSPNKEVMLSPEDIAEAVSFALSYPASTNVSDVTIRPQRSPAD